MKSYRVTVNGRVYEVVVEETGDSGMAEAATKANQPEKTTARESDGPAAPRGPITAGDIPVNAPLSGSVLSVKVKPGESVKAGQVLLTLEALKMENEIVAPAPGVVKEICVQPGSNVSVGDVLLVLRNS